MTPSSICKIKPFERKPETQFEEGFPQIQPISLIESLAEQKYELSRIREQVDEEIARIDAELKLQMTDGDVVFTTHGVGYRLTRSVQDVYDPRVVRELSRMRLLPKFVRVSTTRLKELVSEGRLSPKKFELLHAYATPREIATLREVTLPVADAS